MKMTMRRTLRMWLPSKGERWDEGGEEMCRVIVGRVVRAKECGQDVW